MNEQEWLKCENSEEMVEFVRSDTTKRKLQLFAGACFRRLSHLLPDSRQLQAIELLENAPTDAEVLQRAGRLTRSAMPSSEDSFGGKCRDRDDPYFVALMLFREFRSSSTGHHAAFAARGLADGGIAERQIQTRILHCIFGPLLFRAISVEATFVTPVIRDLAHLIYHEQNFAKLPMLGDLLRQSGCNDADILDHCQQPGPHVRGCWVIDLLMAVPSRCN